MMMKKVILPIVFICMALLSHAGIQDSIGVTKINEKLYTQYMISPGETVYGISTKYGISLTDLFEINPEMENGLKVGQVINIPYNPSAMAKPKPATTKPGAQVYKVQPGDTYYGIAKKYNTSVDQLLKMNNMDLKAGQEIVVGYDNTATTTTTTKPATSTPTKPTTTTPTPATPTPATPNKPAVVVIDTQEPSTTSAPIVETDQPVLSSVAAFAPPFNDLGTPYTYDSTRKQVLVVPFDPYLYFSDADDEIAAKSNMQRTKVREVFRRRLNTLLMAPGYETIHLLGGKNNDTLTDLNKIYSSVSYGYQTALNNPNSIEAQQAQSSAATATSKKGSTKNGSGSSASATEYATPVDNGKYFGVAVRNPDFFKYFDEKYSIDYYIFITQFEVKTNYQNCLDRAALNYERTFTVHYSIFDATGKMVAGDKFKVRYNSNNCYVYQIVSDNVPKMAQKILNQLPPPVAK